MAEISKESELKKYDVLTGEGALISKDKDFVSFDPENKWYKLKSRDDKGNLKKKSGDQVYLRVHDPEMEVIDLKEEARALKEEEKAVKEMLEEEAQAQAEESLVEEKPEG
jgi:exosome complex RNA-binding protein Csl4